MLYRTTLFFMILISSYSMNAQDNSMSYESSKDFPYGKLNPEAPKETGDYEQLIGKCNCKSIRKNADGNWAKPVDMIWIWRYIMNGTGVQDETIKSDKTNSGSIRQYSKDSARWYVHYYTSRSVVSKLPVWEGNKNKNGNIVLYKTQKAPNGTDGFSRLTFYDINDKGYKWIGEWVDKTETVVFPFWKISCIRKEE